MTADVSPLNGHGRRSRIAPGHHEILRARGIPLDLADAAGLESVDGVIAGKLLGRDDACNSGGLAIPYRGTHPVYWRIRMDKGDLRYLCPKGRPIPVYVPPPHETACPDDLSDTLVIVEAPLKALAMSAVGINALGLGGVATTLTDKGELNASWLAVRGLDVRILFDANRATNDNVRAAESRLVAALERAGANVRVCSLPQTAAGEDQGPDDYLAERGPAALYDVIRRAAHTSPWIPLVQVAEDDWYTEAPAKREWLLCDLRHPKARGVLPLGKVGQVIGEGGVSKTMFACQGAVAVATGTPWLGALSVPSPGRVLLVLGEEDAAEARRRLYHAARVANAVPPKGSIVVMPLSGVPAPMVESDQAGNFRDGPFTTWLRDYVRREGFRLIVVDPLSRFGGKEAETENAAATRFMQSLESVVTSTSTILNVHHTNQSSRGGGKVSAISGRGVTGLVDGARWQCALSAESLEIDGEEVRERLGELVTFSVTKSNYAMKPEPILLRRDGEHMGALVPLDAPDLAVVADARGVDRGRDARDLRAAQAEAERCSREDAALGEIMSATGAPTSKRSIRAAMAAALGTCSHDRADAAIERRRRQCQ